MTLTQKLFAEMVGTAFLLATVIGSGIMAEALSGGNVAIALLGNTIPTGAILYVLITMFGPISGAHFNPVVTLAFRFYGTMTTREAGLFILVQIIGGLIGMMAAHFMFELDIVQFSEKARTGEAQWGAEVIATLGLLLTIFGTIKARVEAVPAAVGLYITAAYWFTASTSFANPAVTIARSFTNTFAGINPSHMLGFILAQCVGLLIAVLFIKILAWEPSR
ncbi:MAG: MIP/aquaporin family protein [Hyphomicrobiales bacterium]